MSGLSSTPVGLRGMFLQPYQRAILRAFLCDLRPLGGPDPRVGPQTRPVFKLKAGLTSNFRPIRPTKPAQPAIPGWSGQIFIDEPALPAGRHFPPVLRIEEEPVTRELWALVCPGAKGRQ